MKVMVDSEYLDRLKPVKEYDFVSGEKLIILDERFSSGDDGFVGFGYVDDNEGTVCPALFNYHLDNGKVTAFLGVANGVIFELIDNQLIRYNIKLYTHIITLTAGTNNYNLRYDCSDPTPASNIEDLKLLMNISSPNDSVILPVVNPTDLSTAGLQVTTSLCKIGTANVTTVTDKVIEKQ